MSGYMLFWFCIVTLIEFTIMLFSSCNFVMFWMLLELCSLVLTPLFFIRSNNTAVLSGLFHYLMACGVSSLLIISGVIFPGCMSLMVLGLLIKFNIFPFLGWLYNIGSVKSWDVLLGLSTMLKAPFYVFPLVAAGVSEDIIFTLCGISLMVVSVLFWIHTTSWHMCWCHMMVSSSVTLVIIACVQGVEIVAFYYLTYVLWCCVSVFVLSRMGPHKPAVCGPVSLFFYCLNFLSTPLSLVIVYKLLLCSCMLTVNYVLIVGWIIYTISEQGYLFVLLVGKHVPRSSLSLKRYI
nr:NADH dehydrogenase subunit 2 [Haematoloechus sp. CW13H]